jgi:uncharacterized protein YggE
MRDHRKLVGAALAVVLLLGAAGCAAQAGAADGDGSTRRTIVGTATGRVEGVPDTLTITLGVESRAGSAQAALAQNNERATRVIAALKAAGVADEDLQTSQLSLNPVFDQKGRPDGYGVANIVTARTHDVVNGGKIVDAAAAQAGDDIRVQGVVLSIEDTSDLVAKARADAVRRARRQADQLARAADVGLGPVQRITERRPVQPEYFANQARVAADGAAMSAPIEAGTQELTVDVTVVFGIG